MATNIIETATIIAMTAMTDMAITTAAETEEERVSAAAAAAVSGLILRQRTTGITTTGITSDRQTTTNQTITGTISIAEAVDDDEADKYRIKKKEKSCYNQFS